MSEPLPSETDQASSELEELLEPVPLPALEPLCSGVVLGTPAGELRIESFLGSKGCVNGYEATLADGSRVWLRETQEAASAECLRREYEVLQELRCPMFCRVFACWDQDGRTYLATEPVAGPTLADALLAGQLPTAQVISVLAQAAYALGQLHAQGWLHLALRPSVIVLSKPIRILDLGYATRIGQRPRASFYFAGYSAPELLAERELDARADVYSVGALLFHAIHGAPIPESGAALAGEPPEPPLAGVPQILHQCLGPAETRCPTMSQLHEHLVRLAWRFAPRVRFEHAAATTIGLEPTRTVNQDAYGCCCVQSEAEEGAWSWAVAAVADGMGGMAAGEMASAVAVRTVLAEAGAALLASTHLSAAQQAKWTADWVHQANEKVCQAMQAQQARGGCALACALVLENRLTIAHVGDCRIYLFRDGTLKTLTRDHSVAMSLVLQGELDINRLRESPDRSQLTRSLGERTPLPSYYVDTLAQVTGEESMELRPGDTLLLCSDGLWEPVDEPTLVALLAAQAPDLKCVAQALMARVLQKGAPDNATVLLLRIEAVPLISAEV